MIIEIQIPDNLPEGHRSSLKKGIADALIESATTRSNMDETPEGHGLSRETGKEIGNALAQKIQNAYHK